MKATTHKGMLTGRNRKLIAHFAVVLAVCASAMTLWGQAPTDSSAPSTTMSREVRSDQAGVSLSADKIIDLLKNESGLLLQVKKMLIQKAALQGRLLYEGELTDDVLFQLIRDDLVVRSAVTHEIQRRGYLPLRLTPEEQQQEAMRRDRLELERQKTARDEAEKEGFTAVPVAPSARGIGPVSAPAGTGNTAPQAGTGGPPAAQTPTTTPATPTTTVPQAPVETDINTLMPIRPDQLSLVLGQSGGAATGLSGAGGGEGLPRLGGVAGAGSGAAGLAALSGEIPNPTGEEEPDRYTTAIQFLPLRRPAGAPPAAPSETGIRRKTNPYADVPSLYDLYTQASKPQALQRFGMDVFQNPNQSLNQLPMDLPAGPDYVLGPGDGLRIDLWGGTSQRLTRVVDREGRVALPEVGTVMVAGKTLAQVQREIQSALRTQFKDAQVDVSLLRLRTVRVYVVGDVLSPGPYDISSLSTVLNAVYAAGGPTERGSLRAIRHMRGKELVDEVDLYDLLLHGVREDMKILQPGDTIVVPPLGPTVTIEGMVRRPAIYELHREKNLAEALELAGGVLPTGTLRHVTVERLEAHEKRTMLSLDLPEENSQQAVQQALEEFKVQDGDRITIAPILNYAERSVFLDGHVFRPGKYPYRDDMKVTDLVGTYKDLLPEPAKQYAEIIRLKAPDYRPMVIAFNLADALAGGDQNFPLQPFDTVRIFGRFDLEDPPLITIGGEVRQPGEHRTNGDTRLRDAIYLAGGLTPTAQMTDVQVFRRTPAGKIQVFDFDLGRALAGDPADNILLQPFDRVYVHRSLAKSDPPSVTIQGDVASPGRYPLGSGMTASQLVRVAGGFKRSAYTDRADLSRYFDENGKKVFGSHQDVEIARALGGDASADVTLRDGDSLTIRQLPGWKDIGASIAVRGEVQHPGTYGIQDGERLSDVIRRAGGFRPTAYPRGAVLTRQEVREIEQKTRDQMIQRISLTAPRVNVGVTGTASDAAAVAQAQAQQQQSILAQLKVAPVTGRMVVHISSDISKWENTPLDITVRAGDELVIPKEPDFVLVSGQVYNSTALTYVPGKNAEWYLKRAGGASDSANKKRIYVIRADGSVIGSSSGVWSGGALSTPMQPGDTVVVPEKIFTGPGVWRDLLTIAQFATSLAVAAKVLTQ